MNILKVFKILSGGFQVLIINDKKKVWIVHKWQLWLL